MVNEEDGVMAEEEAITNEVARKVREIVFAEREIGLDEDLHALGLNSLELMGLGNDLEDMYGIAFSPKELVIKNFSTIRTIVELVEQKTNDSVPG